MATIYKRKKDNGKCSYYLNLTINGKRIRKFAGYTLKSAELALRKIEYDITNNQSYNINPLPYDKIIHLYTDYTNSFNISENHSKLLKSKISHFLDYCSKNNINDLKQIRPKDAIDYINIRSKSIVRTKYNSYKDNIYNTIKPTTLNREIAFLKRFFNYCIDMEWIIVNPFRVVKKFKNRGSKQRYYFTKSDIDLIFKYKSKYTDFYTFLLNTGIRPTDAYKVRKKHINGAYLIIRMNKTKDYLKIPLSKMILSLVSTRFNNEYIFPEIQSDRQKRNCLRYIQGLFKPSFIRDNNITLHTFRHTYANNMLNKGVPKEILQTLLGHRSIKTTEIYANWIDIKEVEKYV